MKVLQIQVGDQQLFGPRDFQLFINATEDFDGNGTMDALISISPGGNGSPPEHRFVSVQQGQVVEASIYIGWEDPTIGREGDRITVTFDTEAEISQWAFDGTQAVKLSSQAPNKLDAIAEVTGPGVPFSDPGTRTLLADIDMDGQQDTISCQIWARWGSLLCSLPLPDGGQQELSTGCNRFGVLPTSQNGYHEVVCNNDGVFVFNGSAWVEKP